MARERTEMRQAKKPDLRRIWETFVRIPDSDTNREMSVRSGNHIKVIRSKLIPMISGLTEDGTIDWYCFLIHDRTSGVPTASDDNALYFHLRFALSQSASESKFQSSLPDCCSMTRHVGAEQVSSIAGLDKGLLKNDDIAEAWRIIGEQSEWLLDMLMIHREDARLFPNQVGQFLHYYSNMTGLQVM